MRLEADDITVGPVITGTAEYCSEVVGALGRNVAKLLDPPLGDQVCIGHQLHVSAAKLQLHVTYRVKVRMRFELRVGFITRVRSSVWGYC